MTYTSIEFNAKEPFKTNFMLFSIKTFRRRKSIQINNSELIGRFCERVSFDHTCIRKSYGSIRNTINKYRY